MIDIHCHILPEVDDGPTSWEVSEQMCRMAAADGIEHIVATPHANRRFHYDRESLARALEQLRQRVGKTPRLSLGCDFRLSAENLKEAMSFPERYVIEGGRYLLAEPNHTDVPAHIDDDLRELLKVGIIPVITHPERNTVLQRTPQRILEWVELGCVIQVTASALTGGWGETAWHTAQWLLKREAVHVLASDAHDAARRPPGLSLAREVVAESQGEEIARALVEDNPRAIVSGHALPYFPKPIGE
ncbi:MAG: tyrosine-protein phosphatase [Terriglobales bacterium]